MRWVRGEELSARLRGVPASPPLPITIATRRALAAAALALVLLPCRPAHADPPPAPAARGLAVFDTLAPGVVAFGTLALDAPTLDSLATLAVAESLAADSARAAGARPNPIAELRARYTPETRAYADLKLVLRVLQPLWGIAVAALLLFSGAASWMRDVAHAMGKALWVRVLVVLALYLGVSTLLALPLAWYDDFVLEHQFGLSNQAWSGWVSDQLKGTLFTLAVFGIVPILALVYAAFGRVRRWWLALAIATAPLVLAGTLLQPLVFDPLFNRFTPLADAPLRARILELAERADIPARRVVQVDKSEQTRKFNAYVNGFGASQRIVLWDTTLEGLEDDEILFVTGHEIGHYALGHIWKGIAFTVVLAFALLFLLQRFCDAALAHFGERWGVHGMADVASMPLFVGALSLFALIAQPAVNAYSRLIEVESDAYALEITRDGDAGARTFVKLASQNRSNPEPHPLVRILFSTHPPAIERVRMSMSYRPWERGEPNRYYHGPAAANPRRP